MGTKSAPWCVIEEAGGGFRLLIARICPIRGANLVVTVHKTARNLYLAEPSTMSTNAIAAEVNQPLSELGGSGLVTAWRQRQSLASIWAVAAATLVLGLAYAPNLRDLYSTWNDDPNYSHGKLVIPIALFILWRRLSETSAAAVPTLRCRHRGGAGSS